MSNSGFAEALPQLMVRTPDGRVVPMAAVVDAGVEDARRQFEAMYRSAAWPGPADFQR